MNKDKECNSQMKDGKCHGTWIRAKHYRWDKERIQGNGKSLFSKCSVTTINRRIYVNINQEIDREHYRFWAVNEQGIFVFIESNSEWNTEKGERLSEVLTDVDKALIHLIKKTRWEFWSMKP